MEFKKAINCYTDASITYDLEGSTYVASPGYCITIDGQIVESKNKVIYDATNSYGELYAIYMGVLALKKFGDQNRVLNLFSDSRISIMGLRSWIFNWT